MRLSLDQTWTLVRTGEIETNSVEGDRLDFRIELFERNLPGASEKEYRFRVFRYDLFRLSSVPVAGSSLAYADHELLVADPMFDLATVVADTWDEAWVQFLAIINEQLYDETDQNTP